MFTQIKLYVYLGLGLLVAGIIGFLYVRGESRYHEISTLTAANETLTTNLAASNEAVNNLNESLRQSRVELEAAQSANRASAAAIASFNTALINNRAQLRTQRNGERPQADAALSQINSNIRCLLQNRGIEQCSNTLPSAPH